MMIPSTFEVQHLWAASRCLFLIAPIIRSQALITSRSGTAVTILLYTYHTHYHKTAKTILSGVVNAKAPVATIHYLKHKINVNIQQFCCITIIQGFTWLEAWHISSALTHHIHNIQCLWFWCELLIYQYCNKCVESRNFLTLHMTSNFVPACREPLLTIMSGCDMDLLGMGTCPQMRCHVYHIVS